MSLQKKMFLKSKLKQQPGLIVNSTGDILGRHQGLAFYTLGQRKGLGGGFKEPLFVIGSNREKNELIIGPERKLYKDELLLEKISWVSGHKPKLPLACRARIRYQAEETACHLDGRNKQMVVQLKKAQRAITPGQSVVFYKGKVVLGGGIIER